MTDLCFIRLDVINVYNFEKKMLLSEMNLIQHVTVSSIRKAWVHKHSYKRMIFILASPCLAHMYTHTHTHTHTHTRTHKHTHAQTHTHTHTHDTLTHTAHYAHDTRLRTLHRQLLAF